MLEVLCMLIGATVLGSFIGLYIGYGIYTVMDYIHTRYYTQVIKTYTIFNGLSVKDALDIVRDDKNSNK